MKNLKKYFCVLMAALLLLVMLPTSVLALENYNENDFNKLKAFLNQPSAVAGKTNGQQLNSGYNENDPTTWTSVVWNNDSPKRVVSISDNYYWGDKSLAGNLDLSGCEKLLRVLCYRNEINSINVSGCTSLDAISCGGNNLTSLNVNGATALAAISCDDNQLTSLDLSNTPNLATLYCGENELTSLDLSNCPRAGLIYCYDNELTSLNLSECTKLWNLYCENNKLTSLDISNKPELTEVNCSKNNISQLITGNNSDLIRLNCNNNTIGALDLSSATDIQEISCNNNQLTSLIVNSDEMYQLLCDDNYLTNLDLSNVYNINYFSCRNNKLKSLVGRINDSNITLSTVGRGYITLQAIFYYTMASEIQSFSSEYGDYGTFEAMAVPEEGAQFIKWTIDSELFSQFPVVDLTEMEEEGINLVAHFSDPEVSPYPSPSITITPSPSITITPSPTPTTTPPQGVAYYVYFDLNGGLYNGGGNIVQAVVEGDAAVAPITTRQGYQFAGWDQDFSDVRRVLNVKAIWEEVQPAPPVVKVKVTYDANGGTGSIPVDTKEYDVNSTVTLASGSDISRTGYEFAGWAYTKDGEVITTSDIAIKENTTLYAIWVAIPTEVPEEPVVEEPEEEEPVIDIPEPEQEEPEEALPDTSAGNNGIFLGGLMLLSGGAVVAFEAVRRRRQRNCN